MTEETFKSSWWLIERRAGTDKGKWRLCEWHEEEAFAKERFETLKIEVKRGALRLKDPSAKVVYMYKATLKNKTANKKKKKTKHNKPIKQETTL
jgi:hypothetical protein